MVETTEIPAKEEEKLAEVISQDPGSLVYDRDEYAKTEFWNDRFRE